MKSGVEIQLKVIFSSRIKDIDIEILHNRASKFTVNSNED